MTKTRKTTRPAILGERLSIWRRRAGHTQEILGTLLGVTGQTVRNVESGTVSPRIDLVERWAALCGFSVPSLYRADEGEMPGEVLDSKAG